MVFALEISALLFAAAWVAERALLAARRPLRGVWIAAIVGTNVLPLIISQLPSTSTLTERWALSVAPQSVLARISNPLLGVWAIALAIGLFVCLSAVWRMSRTRPSWKSEHVDSTPVLVSHDIGPALVGVLQYSIVVPHWAYSLETRARTLLLAHEREHARQYDPLLLAAAVLTVVIAPWNVFNWLFLKRLHLAVEMDCDQRVLRAHPDARCYAALLLDVAERVLPSVMPAAAFVEHGASLETRLKAITETQKPPQWLRVSSGLAASVALVAAACVMPRPIVIGLTTPGTAIAPVIPAPVAAATTTTTHAPVTEPAANIPLKAPVAIASQSLTTTPVNLAKGGTSTVRDPELVPADIRVALASKLVQQLDEKEFARLRAAVLSVAPEAFGNWPRRDSALVLLFDSNGDVLNAAKIAKPRDRGMSGDAAIFTQIFMISEISVVRGGSRMTLTHGARGEVLGVPLTLFSGRMPAGATAPLTIEQALPSKLVMLETVRRLHPELLKETSDTGLVGALFYGSKGQLLASNAVHTNYEIKNPDGTSNSQFEFDVIQKAQKKMPQEFIIVKTGAVNLSESPGYNEGPANFVYTLVMTGAELMRSARNAEPLGYDVGLNGSSSRGYGKTIDQRALGTQLLNLVATRVPEAFGEWSRADSAVVFLFDSENQLIGRRAAPLPKNQTLGVVSELVSRNFPGVKPLDVEAVGHWSYSCSDTGRELDHPLRVIWARLEEGKSLLRPRR